LHVSFQFGHLPIFNFSMLHFIFYTAKWGTSILAVLLRTASAVFLYLYCFVRQSACTCLFVACQCRVTFSSLPSGAKAQWWGLCMTVSATFLFIFCPMGQRSHLPIFSLTMLHFFFLTCHFVHKQAGSPVTDCQCRLSMQSFFL
jgi:hypothetical protein